MVRKPRDFDAELQALMDRAKKVKGQKTIQLGKLVQITGADHRRRRPPVEALAGALLAAVSGPRRHPRPSRGGPNADRPSFSKGASGGRRTHRALLLRDLQAAAVQLSRIQAVQSRGAQALHDARDWVQERRARTRQLIELGGLVQKAGLVELTGDDRATLLGAMMEMADQLRAGRDKDTSADARTPAQLAAAWRHRGLRAFEADREADAA